MKQSSKNNVTRVQFITQEPIQMQQNQQEEDLDVEIKRILLSQAEYVAHIVSHEIEGMLSGAVSSKECIKTIMHNTNVLIDSIKSIGI